MASAVHNSNGASDRLYAAIGEFLARHRLSVDPAHYAFAHKVLSDERGPLAATVARLTDGGVRLSSRDIEELGGHAVAGTPAGAPPEPSSPPQLTVVADNKVQSLVARAQMQVEGFSDTVRAFHADTRGFGRDLRASRDAIRATGDSSAIDEVVRMASSMLDRVLSAEAKLSEVTQEADKLRHELEEARDDARRDPLTGLPNRRAFEDAFTTALTERANVSVAICDVDKFKSVNDRFGHVVGDRVLKAIAEALRSGCDEHLVARYGGEEFVVMFTGLAPADALSTLEGARAAVAAKRYRLRETDAPLGAVTFSAGLTAVEPGDTIGSALGRADRLLYAAKEDGRNCIHIDQ
ncbi:MAG: GGDEF domain-containing protein [Sphingomonas sp.]|uniref:GGDEF domain-containing protein n=1 Tax=Sphingomonas sp. TaxID=28214 RepID=UPI003F8237D7